MWTPGNKQLKQSAFEATVESWEELAWPLPPVPSLAGEAGGPLLPGNNCRGKNSRCRHHCVDLGCPRLPSRDL